MACSHRGLLEDVHTLYLAELTLSNKAIENFTDSGFNGRVPDKVVALILKRAGGGCGEGHV